MVGETKALTVAQEYGREKIDLIKRTVAVGVSDDELELFLYQAKRTGLDPLARQIHCVKRGERATIQVAIDGYRLIADRTGKYAGNDDPVFEGSVTVRTENTAVEAPAKASVTVWKLVGGVRCPFTATARWSEYYPGDRLGFQWRKMPHLMLGKCSEALALRKAFPAELSGIYTKEEMDQADVVEAEAREAPPAAKPAPAKPQTAQPQQPARPAAARPADNGEREQAMVGWRELWNQAVKLGMHPSVVVKQTDDAATIAQKCVELAALVQKQRGVADVDEAPGEQAETAF